MIIQNRQELSANEMREKALDILEAGVEGVSPEGMLDSLEYNSDKKILKIKDKKYVVKGRIFVVGGGKAAGLIARKLEQLIPDIEAGIISCKEGYDLEKIKVIKAGHPIPNRKSEIAAKKMYSLKEKYSIDKNDLILCIVSGGISSLIVYPAKGIFLKNKKKIDRLLVNSGANINEMNIVRKHISRIKGGYLAEFFSPAKVVSLILSDVVGDDLSTIGSGLTVEDHTTYKDSYEVLEKYNLLKKTPRRILKRLKRGINGEISETPKRIHNAYNILIGNNSIALRAMKVKARKLGFNPYVIMGQKGNVGEIAKKRFEEIFERKYKKHDAIIIGGETSLVVPKKHGKGGRNMHYALISLKEIIKSEKEIVVASMGTDGSDFMKGVSGAIVDRYSVEEMKGKKLDLEKSIKLCDSYNFFKKLGSSLIFTKATGTNVSDIIVYLIV
jgi:glycerate-2-kinase